MAHQLEEEIKLDTQIEELNIEKVVTNTIDMDGSIKGIVGSAVFRT